MYSAKEVVNMAPAPEPFRHIEENLGGTATGSHSDNEIDVVVFPSATMCENVRMTDTEVQGNNFGDTGRKKPKPKQHCGCYCICTNMVTAEERICRMCRNICP